MFLQIIPLPYKILAIALLVASVAGFSYTKGYSHASDKYELQIAQSTIEAEKKYNELLIKKNRVDIQVVTEYVEKIKEVVKWRTKNVEIIIDSVPDTCELSDGWVSVHDSSAKAVSADSTRASDATPSGITAPQALKTISNNYSICKENSDRLASLQNWIHEQEKLMRASNAK